MNPKTMRFAAINVAVTMGIRFAAVDRFCRDPEVGLSSIFKLAVRRDHHMVIDSLVAD
jgi:hypothetical protein